MTVVKLPVLSWGTPHSPQKILLVHGLGSSAATLWRIGTELAAVGYYTEAVDLRGHGNAPHTLTYSIADFAADLAVHTAPEGSWTAVISHSIGSAAAIVASKNNPEWTQRLILLDPAILTLPAEREAIGKNQLTQIENNSLEYVRSIGEHWHPQDVFTKYQAVAKLSPYVIESVVRDNDPWDVREQASQLTLPTLVVGADPAVHALFAGEIAEQVLENKNITLQVVEGAGHNVHRDKPEEVLKHIVTWLQ